MNLKSARAPLRVLSIAALLLALTERTSSAQETLKIQNVSRDYDLVVRVAACGHEQYNPNLCNGATRISLYHKGASSPFQVLHLPNTEIYKDTIAYNPKISTKRRGLYDDEYSFVFEDFNFDGKDDLAICNGRRGGYGGPSYTIFLFEQRSRRFVKNRSLSRLAEGAYLGLFFVESKKKRIVTFSKSGCCYHETEFYMLVGNRPRLVEKVIEDVEHGVLEVTRRKLVNGRWMTTVTRKKAEQ